MGGSENAMSKFQNKILPQIFDAFLISGCSEKVLFCHKSILMIFCLAEYIQLSCLYKKFTQTKILIKCTKLVAINCERGNTSKNVKLKKKTIPCDVFQIWFKKWKSSRNWKHHIESLEKVAIKFPESFQKVSKKFSESCHKIARKLPESFQKGAGKMSKKFQKVST